MEPHISLLGDLGNDLGEEAWVPPAPLGPSSPTGSTNYCSLRDALNNRVTNQQLVVPGYSEHQLDGWTDAAKLGAPEQVQPRKQASGFLQDADVQQVQGPGASTAQNGGKELWWRRWWRSTWDRANLSWQVFADIIQRRPRVLVAPLLLLCLFCGLGVFGVVFAAERAVQTSRTYAHEAVAATAARAIESQLEIATFALVTITAYITQQPDCSVLNKTYNNISSIAMKWDAKDLVYQIQALPAARLNYIYPPVTGELEQLLMGRDLLQVPMYRNDTLHQIRSRGQRVVLGPYKLLEGFAGMFVTYPIFLPAPYEAYDWGCGVQPYDCPPGVCWLPEEGLKLWGLATSVLSLDNMQADFRFQALAIQGYSYKLHQLGTEVNRPTVIAESHPPPHEPVTATVRKFNLVWELEVAPTAGWKPAWAAPCIAAVVVGSAAVSLLVLWLLVTREKHNMLLRAMLPRKVIKQLQRGDKTVVEEFLEPVTILFSDIVSYTEVASQLSPLQVVRLLNDLYMVFDELTDKHGVYKVETIGDAFMCVSGCPLREDPVRAAARMAAMAADMIAAVEAFSTVVGDEELRVKIRIGLHSGPVVAGVIGQRMPRYCLFGDTVNTASRMESNSSPMCIHVSDATAELLRAGGAEAAPVRAHAPPLSRCVSAALDAVPRVSKGGEHLLFGEARGGPQISLTAQRTSLRRVIGLVQQQGREEKLVLHSRGRVMIKGKGIMETYWLGHPPADTPQHPCPRPPPTEADSHSGARSAALASTSTRSVMAQEKGTSSRAPQQQQLDAPRAAAQLLTRQVGSSKLSRTPSWQSGVHLASRGAASSGARASSSTILERTVLSTSMSPPDSIAVSTRMESLASGAEGPLARAAGEMGLAAPAAAPVEGGQAAAYTPLHEGGACSPRSKRVQDLDMQHPRFARSLPRDSAMQVAVAAVVVGAAGDAAAGAEELVAGAGAAGGATAGAQAPLLPPGGVPPSGKPRETLTSFDFPRVGPAPCGSATDVARDRHAARTTAAWLRASSSSGLRPDASVHAAGAAAAAVGSLLDERFVLAGAGEAEGAGCAQARAGGEGAQPSAPAGSSQWGPGWREQQRPASSSSVAAMSFEHMHMESLKVGAGQASGSHAEATLTGML